jgi:hypothetical protein
MDGGRVLAYVHTNRPITDEDRAAIERFRQILTRTYQEEPNVTGPNQTHNDDAKGVDLDEAGVAGWYFVLQQIAKQKAALEEAEEDAKEKIKAALGDRVDGTIDGKPVVRWLHTAAPAKLDTKALKKDHPDLVAEYTRIGKPGRRFELVKPKADA